MIYLGIMDNGQRESLNFGDVPASEATLTFDLPKIKARGLIEQPTVK